MTNRQLAVLTLVAAAMVLVTVVLYTDWGSPRDDFTKGMLLVQGLDTDAVDAITIRRGLETVTIRAGNAGFSVAEKHDYPASPEKVNDLVIDLLEIRCADKITDRRADHGELGVAEDSDDATTVTFIGADGEALIAVVQGETVEGGRGSYVRLADGDTVYLSEEYLHIDTDPTSYLDRTLVNMDRDDVRKVTVTSPDGAYTISRGDDDEIALIDVPEGKRPLDDKCGRVFHALSGLRMSDVLRASDAGFEWDVAFECEIEGGLAYTARLAENDDKHYVRLSARGSGIEQVEITRTESEEELERKEAMLLAEERALAFNERHAGWVYEIQSWTAETLRTPLADLIEDVPEDDVPEEIAASHILISYSGTERSESERTKEEAQALAERVLQEARAEGADFAELARQYSDGPSGPDGGDLGTFKREMMDDTFSDAAFALEVGAVSDVVETPFGFHIIKRTE